MEHLTQWRMVRAASMMRQKQRGKMSAIASAVGYESESSFGKVFRRVMGVSPGKYRHSSDEAEIVDVASPIAAPLPARNKRRAPSKRKQVAMA